MNPVLESLGDVGERDRSFLLDPATGDIGGKTAVVVYPAVFADEEIGNVLDPEGFTAHLAPVRDPSGSEVLEYPCGAWFLPPPGRYRVFVTGNGKISPFSTLLVYGDGAFTGRGMAAALPVVEAGRVNLSESWKSLSADSTLRLLHGGPYLAGSVPRRELSRQERVTSLTEGLLMPPGKAIAALWDPALRRYSALSRPFLVEANRIRSAPLERPRDSASLVVQLRSKKMASVPDDYWIGITLVSGRTRRAPSVVIPTLKIFYAVWYEVPEGSATLTARTKDLELEPTPIELKNGEIGRFIGRLEPATTFGDRPSWTQGARK